LTEPLLSTHTEFLVVPALLAVIGFARIIGLITFELNCDVRTGVLDRMVIDAFLLHFF
jgi:hypothetical protein